MDSGKRWVLWIGVSSVPQADDETKDSLPEQERRLRAVVEQNEGRIVDVIIIPGHSRDYYTYAEFCEGVRNDPKLKTDAPSRLWEHWRKRDFDVFACMDGTRFGREQSIVAEVVGRTYDANAVIYSHKDGFVERNNRRWFAMLTGYQAAGEIDELKRRRHFGMNKRAERGLPTSTYVLFPYTLIRDEHGRAARLEVDESQRRLWNDVYDLLVNEKISWGKLETALAEHGHLQKNGKPHYPHRFRNLLHNPTFWGHSARFYALRGKQNLINKRATSWVYDPNEPTPEGVLMIRDTHPPVYTGEQRETLISELLRRKAVVGGHVSPAARGRYAGLLACGECGYTLSSTVIRKDGGAYRYYRCDRYNHSRVHSQGAPCTQKKSVPMEYLDRFVQRLIALAIEQGTMDAAMQTLFGHETEKPSADTHVQLENELATLTDQARRVIRQQTAAPESLQGLYEEELMGLAARIDAVQKQLKRLPPPETLQQNAEQSELAYLRGIDLGDLFALDDAEINRRLHRLMGRRRLVVVDGEIVGVTNARRR